MTTPSWIRIALAAALTGLAGLSFAPLFGGFGAVLLLAVLAPPAVVLGWALLTRFRSADARVRLGPTMLGVLAVAGTVAVVTRPGGAVASGPYRLLTGALPADPSGPELATVSALTGYAALIACRLALTRRAPLAPVLPALVCLLAGLGLGAATAALPAWYPAAFVALAGLQLLVSRPAGGGRSTVLATALVVLAVGVVAPVGLGGLASGSVARDPASLRSLVSGPVTPKTRTNPFAQYVALREGRLVLTMTGSATAPVERLRMITLTEFDGHTWSTRADYRRAGHRLPPASTATGSNQITMEVSVGNPEPLGWLPTPGRATEINVTDLGVDEATGDVVVPAGSATPASYRVTGVEPVISSGEILDDEPARAATPLGIGLSPEILGFIGTTTGTQLPDSDRLFALYQAFTKPPFGYDGSREAAGGHGTYQISALLRDKRGTSEQYASAFAVLCRQLGWDSRVVLGFYPQWNGNTFTVSGKDIHAWTEVRFNRLGWVPFDPTPQQVSPGREPGNGQAPPPRRNDPVDSVPDPGQQSFEPPSSDPAPVASAQPASPAGQPTWLTVMIVVGAALLLLVAAIPAAKAVRRARRRRTGSARRRTVAAWLDALDTLRETGQRVPRTATTGEVVGASDVRCGPAIRALAARTDFAAFAPDQAGAADAAAAWADSDLIRRTTRRHLRASTRIRTTFDPRPLLARRLPDWSRATP
jgi:hypothetical protein